MNVQTQDNIIYLERLLDARLDSDTFKVFLNRTQMNVDVIGTDFRFYTNVAASTRARLFLYKRNGKMEDEHLLRDIVGRMELKFRLWDHIDESKTYSNQVAMSGVMLENVPQLIKKITEQIYKEFPCHHVQ